MSSWWYVIAILALIVIGYFYMRYRRNSGGIRNDDRSDSTLPARDFTEERQTNRVSHMSEEDLAWEAQSQARDRTAREPEQTPPVQR